MKNIKKSYHSQSLFRIKRFGWISLCVLIGIFIMDNFKDIKGYEGVYKINELGQIKSIHLKSIIKNQVSKRGYEVVKLYDGIKPKRFFVHRLIAIAFIPNKNNLPFINHKNGVKSDNRIENLEWCTHKENMIHAHRTGLSKISDKCKIAVSKKNKLYTGVKNHMSIPVFNIETGEEYVSISEAAQQTGFNKYVLYDQLSGRRKNKTNLTLKII